MDNGVVKKVDELGRIVIPKDIRKNLKINNGDVLKIFVDGQNIQLAKYSDVLFNVEHIKKVFDAFLEIYNVTIAFTDRENILLSNNKLLFGKIDDQIIMYIDSCESKLDNECCSLKFNNNVLTGYFYLVPIITSLSACGSIILYSENFIKDYYQDILRFISKYVAKLVDISC